MKKFSFFSIITFFLLTSIVYATDPTIESIDDQRVHIGSSLNDIAIEVSDADGDSIIITATEDSCIDCVGDSTFDDGFYIDTNDLEFSWTPQDDDVGLHEITITAEDNTGETSSVSFTIEVYERISISITTDCEGIAIMGEEYTCTIIGDDGSSNTFTYSLQSMWTDSTDDMTIDSSTGEISWTPDEEDIGFASFIVFAMDDDYPPEGTSKQMYVIVQEMDYTGRIKELEATVEELETELDSQQSAIDWITRRLNKLWNIVSTLHP